MFAKWISVTIIIFNDGQKIRFADWFCIHKIFSTIKIHIMIIITDCYMNVSMQKKNSLLMIHFDEWKTRKATNYKGDLGWTNFRRKTVVWTKYNITNVHAMCKSIFSQIMQISYLVLCRINIWSEKKTRNDLITWTIDFRSRDTYAWQKT